MDYYQDLCELCKGLYFKAHIPFVHVENNLKLNVSEESPVAFTGIIKNYFAGKYEGFVDTDKQTVLTHAKIDGNQEATGFADLDAVLGYKLINKEKGYMAINLGFTIPTGNTVEGDYLFEPVYGNGQHFGFGGGFEAEAKLWESDNHKDTSFKLTLAADFRYLFKGTEKRTLGLNAVGNAGPEYSQYFWLGKYGVTGELIPAANILTTCVNVTPGGQAQGLVAFELCAKKFTLDFGYNVFYKDNESVTLKNSPFGTTEYGIAATNFDITSALNATNAVGGRALTTNDINLNAATTPTQITHKFFGGLGFTYKEWKHPILIGLGGSYEFAQENGAIEAWGLWLKAGLAF